MKCLELLGNEIGMFGKRVMHDVPGDVRALMAAVAARGKPQLAPPRRPALTLDAAVSSKGSADRSAAGNATAEESAAYAPNVTAERP